jgi:hypothetical protein
MPTPEMVYTILDALYREYSDTPDEDLDAIRYIEKRLAEQDLPLTRDEYAGAIKSPEYNEWKDIDVIFPIPVGH